jgi:hypothetical protein
MANNIMVATSQIPQGLYNGQIGTTPALLYTVPAGASVIVKHAAAADTSDAAVTFTLGIVPSGGSWDGTHTIIDTVTVNPGDSVPLAPYLRDACLNTGDAIWGSASAADSVNVLITGTVFLTGSSGLPSGVTLFGPDISSSYWDQWLNGPRWAFPVIVSPFEENPAELLAMGVNAATPTRDDQAGGNRPVWVGTNSAGDDMSHVLAADGFYAGGQYWYRCQPSISATQTTTTEELTLPAATIPVASTAQWDLAGMSWAEVSGDILGQILVTSTAGVQTVTFQGISGDSFIGCAGGTGTVADGAVVGGVDWGSPAGFLHPGDEFDGAGAAGYDTGTPASISANDAVGGWGGLTVAAFQGMAASSRSIDDTRPLYLQCTTTLVDSWNFYHYTTLAEKQDVFAAFDIISFDVYPVETKGQHVFANYDYVMEARAYANPATPADLQSSNPLAWLEANGSSKPVLTYVETGLFSGGSVTPTPAQTVSLSWNAIVGGASGLEYFDGVGSPQITNTSSNAAMHDAIAAFNTIAAGLAPVLASQYANGFVTVSDGTSTTTVQGWAVVSPTVMVRYYESDFYVFVAPHVLGESSATLSFAGITGVMSIQQTNIQTSAVTTVETNSSGELAVSFSDENQGYVFVVPNPEA